MLVLTPGVHCHTCVSSTGGYASVYCAVQRSIAYGSTVSLLQAPEPRGKHKGSGDGGIPKKHQVLKTDAKATIIERTD